MYFMKMGLLIQHLYYFTHFLHVVPKEQKICDVLWILLFVFIKP